MVSSSELEQQDSPPGSRHRFTMKYYHYARWRGAAQTRQLAGAQPSGTVPHGCCHSPGDRRTASPSSEGSAQTPTHRESRSSRGNWCSASERRGTTASRHEPKIWAEVLELLKGSPWKRKGTTLSGEHPRLFKALLWHAVRAVKQLHCCREPTTTSSTTRKAWRIQLWWL